MTEEAASAEPPPAAVLAEPAADYPVTVDGLPIATDLDAPCKDHQLLPGDQTGFPVLVLYTQDPAWSPGEVKSLIDLIVHLTSALSEAGMPATLVPVCDPDLEAALRPFSPDEYTVVNVCDGIPGIPRSYGRVAEALERLGFGYTGSPPDVLAQNDDKRENKRMLEAGGVPTPRWRVYESPDPGDWDVFPAIVKPALEHCSVGISPQSVVMTPAELSERIAYVLDVLHEPALVEDFIDGREFRVPLWEGSVVEMLPPVELSYAAFQDPHDRLCPWDGNFDPASRHFKQIQMLAPAALAPDEYHRLEGIALAAYAALRCRDYARLDVRLRDGTFYVLDVNANPYIGPDSSVITGVGLAGYPHCAFVSHLANRARRRRGTPG